MNEQYDRELSVLQKRLDALKPKERMAYETASLHEDVKNRVLMRAGGSETGVSYNDPDVSPVEKP